MTRILKPAPIWEGAPVLTLGEGPTWLPDPDGSTGELLVVNIATGPDGGIHRFVPAAHGPRRHQFWATGDEPASFAPIEGRPGELLVAHRQGLSVLDLASQLARARALLWPLVHAPYDTQILRNNDGKADRHGNFWVGLYDKDGERGSLYCYSLGELLTVVDGGIGSSNGLAWSPDGRLMYRSDTRKHVIYVADVVDGILGTWREFLRFPTPDSGEPYQGRPDGGDTDSEGNYWTAMYKGSQVRCYSPSGELLLVVDTSDYTDCPTMACHGGPNLTTLYIAGVNCPVLKVEVDIPGLPVNHVRL